MDTFIWHYHRARHIFYHWTIAPSGYKDRIPHRNKRLAAIRVAWNGLHRQLSLLHQSYARLQRQLTRKQLAEKLQISQRHLMTIENEQKHPSYDLLFALIRELHIPSDMVFYRERQKKFEELHELRHLLSQCDSKDLNIVMSIVQSLLDNKADMR